MRAKRERARKRKFTTVSMPIDLMESIDIVVKEKKLGYESRAEFIKDCVRHALQEIEIPEKHRTYSLFVITQPDGKINYLYPQTITYKGKMVSIASQLIGKNCMALVELIKQYDNQYEDEVKRIEENFAKALKGEPGSDTYTCRSKLLFINKTIQCHHTWTPLYGNKKITLTIHTINIKPLNARAHP